MNGFLLDTDTLTLAQFGHSKVIAQLALRSDSDIRLGVVSLQEQMQGWLGRFGKLKQASQLADWYDRFAFRMLPVWRRYTVLAFPLPAIVRFEQLRSQRLNVGLMDLRLAAIALENGLTVVTRNLRDFQRVPGLAAENWCA